MSGRKSLYLLFGIVLLAIILLTQFMGQSTIDPTTSLPSNDNTNVSEEAGAAAPSADTVKLRIAVSMNPAEFFTLQKFNQNYVKSHPGIEVSLDNLPTSEAYERLKETAKSGQADIMLLSNAWVNEFAASGYLSNRTDEWFTSDAQAKQFPLTLKQIKWNGYIWGVPKDADMYVLAWNKDFLEKNQLQPPASPEQLLELNKKLLQTDPGAGLYVDPEDPYAFASLLWAIGGSWPKQDNAGGEDSRQSADLLNAFYFLADKGKKEEGDGKMAGYSFVSADFDPWQRLNEADIPLMIASASDYLRHRSDQLGITFLSPAAAGKSFPGAVITGRSFCISAYSDKTKASLDWIQAVNTQENQVEILQKHDVLPAMSTAYDALANGSDPLFSDMRSALEQGMILSEAPSLYRKMEQLQALQVEFYAGDITAGELAEGMKKLE